MNLSLIYNFHIFLAVGAYHPENTDLYRKKDFNNGNSSVFRKPIAQKVTKESEVPAPNEYNVSNANKQQFKTNNVCADSAFKSNTKREFLSLDKIKNLPAPGTYNVNDDVLHESSKVPFSSFKSTVQRNTFVPIDNIPGFVYIILLIIIKLIIILNHFKSWRVST